VYYELGKDPKTGERRQRMKTFADLDEAKNFLAARVNDVRNRGRRTDPGSTTVAEWCRQWMQQTDDAVLAGDLRQSTADFYRSRITRHIIPNIGAIRLRDLTLDDIRDFYKTLTPSVREKVQATLRPALSDAVDEGRLATNPALLANRGRRGKKGKTHRPRRWNAWDENQLGLFLGSLLEDRLFAMWRTYATTGARRGELLALDWSDVDLEAGRIHIWRSLTPSGRMELTKTDRDRWVDLDDETAAALGAWETQQKRERLKAGVAWKGTGWVFTTLRGVQIKPDWTSRRFQAIREAAGLPHIRLHDVRHSWASIALRAGVPVHVVAERLGHSSTQTTMNTYAHSIGSQQRDAAATVAKLLPSRQAQ
jgi:integrase